MTLPNSTDAVGGQPVTVNQINQLFDLLRAVQGLAYPLFPLTAVASSFLALDLYYYTAAFTYGSTPKTSNGYFQTAAMPALLHDYANFPGNKQLLDSTRQTTALASAVVTNDLFLLPDHLALKLKRWVLTLRIGSIPGSNYQGYWSKTEVLVVKVAADGTETTLDTVTETTSVNLACGLYTSGIVEKTIVKDYGGSPLSLATGERLGLRVKAWGYKDAATTGVPMIINGGPQTTGYAASTGAPVTSRFLMELTA